MKHDFMQTLERIGAIKRGSHFVYNSWLHGSDYVDKTVLFHAVKEGNPLDVQIGRYIAEKYENQVIGAVLGPADGGNRVAQWVKGAICCKIPDVGFQPICPQTVDTEQERRFRFRDGGDKLLEFKKVVVVEDVIHTGASIKDVLWLVEKHGGEVIAVETLCNRGNQTAETLGVPVLNSLIDVEFETFEDGSCPLCDRGIPIDTTVGRGKEYVERQAIV